MVQLLETLDHTYRDLTLELLNTFHMEITSGPRCQEGYISFYLNMEFFALNLNAFNSIFSFPPSLNLDCHHVPREFNPNTF